MRKSVLSVILIGSAVFFTSCATSPSSNGSSSSSAGSSSSAAPSPYDYHVATNGSDSNPGTESQPFKTITHAIQVAGTNCSIKVFPGTYNEISGETFPLAPKRGQQIIGDQANYGLGSVPTRIECSNTNRAPEWDSFYCAIYITNKAQISGFSIWSGDVYMFIFEIIAVNSEATIVSNTFQTNSYGGIYLDQSCSGLIKNNRFQPTYYGVYANYTMTGSLVIDNNYFGSSDVAVNIGIGNSALIIRNNLIIGNGSGGISIQNGTAVISNNVLSNNLFNWGALSCNNSTPVVRNNVFYCISNGVYLTTWSSAQPRPDLGTTNSPGLNDFSHVTYGAIYMGSNINTNISAVGNIWAHTPPTKGTDIVFSPFSAGRVYWGSNSGDFYNY